MDNQSAKNLVINAFENGFDKTVFLNFIRNLVKKFDESKAFQAHGYVKDKFKKTTPIIKTYERLGTYTDPEEKTTDILIVYLNKDNSIEARSSLRNFVADYLKQRNAKDSALVAFVAPSNDDWRFSLVKMEYQLEKSAQGKLKATTKLTPAKRYSFLVGENENSYTAKKQFLSLLTNDQSPLLSEFEAAFNVEKVTKEFFAKYRELFNQLKESLDNLVNRDEKIKKDLDEKKIDTADFVKKLLGQIVFLYFLQKKGWFGVERDKDWGTGSKKFLRELFEKKHGSYKNFFNDILEPLFYEALRNDRSYDKHYFSLFKCKIPFLNGGLFDPINDYDWTETDILLSNNLFSNNNLTKEGDIGDGILDIFDRYNFTVKEDEPLEKEVAIDPEMLGKVFENLLEVKDRKSKGTYYTPREIVHYMCQQSLINYLATELKEKVDQKDIDTLIKYGETTVEHDKNLAEKEKTEEAFKLPKGIIKNAKIIDDKLADIRVCDPAVGSGAFLVGMMTEIIKARNALTSHLKNKEIRSPYIFKRQAIEKSLYGVDIDLGAVEIAKLRLWLSLIVDEENIKDIKPLPNLDYKIMQGNSLIEYVTPESLAITNEPDRTKLIRFFNQSKQEYLSTYDPGQKKVKRDQINKLIEEIMLYDQKRKLETDKAWQKFQQLKQDNLFGEKNEQMAFGGLSEKEKEKLKQQIEEFNQLKSLSPVDHFEWHLNYNEVFDQKNGFDVMISNPPYIVLSSDVLKGYTLIQGNNNAYTAFLELAKKHININGVSIYIIPTTWLAGNNFKELRKFLLETKSLNQIVQLPYDIFEVAYVDNVILIFNGSSIQNEVVNTFKFNIKDSVQTKIKYDTFHITEWMKDEEYVIFLNEHLVKILDKYRNPKSILLGSIANIQRGTLPPKRNQLITNINNKSHDLIPWFNGQVYRYVIKQGDHFFVSYKNLLENKSKELFQCIKILGRQLVSRQFKLQFTFFDKECAFKKNLYAIYNLDKSFDYFYILAILNSQFYSYIQVSMNSSGQRDDYPAFSLQDFKKFLIPHLDKKNQKPFVEIVDRILKITSTENYDPKNPPQEQKLLETKIDQMVYKLYGLTPEEIKIVED